MSPLEKNIYRYMELDDRVHDEDQSVLRSGLYKLHEQAVPLHVQVRMKSKAGPYLLMRIDGQAELAQKLLLFELRQELGHCRPMQSLWAVLTTYPWLWASLFLATTGILVICLAKQHLRDKQTHPATNSSLSPEEQDRAIILNF